MSGSVFRTLITIIPPVLLHEKDFLTFFYFYQDPENPTVTAAKIGAVFFTLSEQDL